MDAIEYLLIDGKLERQRKRNKPTTGRETHCSALNSCGAFNANMRQNKTLTE